MGDETIVNNENSQVVTSGKSVVEGELEKVVSIL
jgi:hypothetical protein